MNSFSKFGGLVALALLLSALAIGPAYADDTVSLSRASGPSPFRPGCNGAPQTGTNYRNAEVEPWIAVDPGDPAHLIGVWQQDRWSNGGANGLLTGVSHDGGRTWVRTAPHFTRCAGGNAGNGGDYERASDPWVSFSPDGTAHQISLSFDDSDGNQAILVSRSRNGGAGWSEPITLQRDTSLDFGPDKESITADPRSSRFVYAVWDRLEFDSAGNFIKGPTWFSRTTNGGASWEPARVIFDPGLNGSTLSNQIVVLPDGTLLNLFDLFNDQDVFVAVMRSTDRGLTWSRPIIVNSDQSIGVVDPKIDEAVRVGDTVPDIAVDAKTGAVYIVWEDARFSGGRREGIAFVKSTDGGLTWSAPVQVNKVKRVQAFTAAVDVARDGTVGITYYDFRNDTSDSNVLLTSAWLLTSSNGGKTWDESRISKPFDMRLAPDAGGFFLGDYEGLAHRGKTFLPFFVKTNAGNRANRTDVFAALHVEDSAGVATNDREEINAHPQSLLQRVEAHRENRRR